MPATPTRNRRGAVPPEDLPRRANRQHEVTMAASEIFWRKGYTAASIQDVADKVGVLKGSLYYYISSKEDLLWRIIEDVHERSTKILDEARALDVTPTERIRIYFARHVEWYLDNVAEVSVFFHEWRHLTGERLTVARERRRGYEQVVRELFAASQEVGDISADLDLHYAARYVLAAVNAVPDWYVPTGKDSASTIAENYADMTVALLTSPSPLARTSRDDSQADR